MTAVQKKSAFHIADVKGGNCCIADIDAENSDHSNRLGTADSQLNLADQRQEEWWPAVYSQGLQPSSAGKEVADMASVSGQSAICQGHLSLRTI